MAKPSCDIEKVYKEFGTIDSYFYEEENNGTTSLISKGLIDNYCHYENKSGNGNCHNDYFEMTSSSVIHLINNLKGKCGLDFDKLAEYAILWLSFKLNKKPQHKFAKLNDFYNSHIENNKCYNDIIKDSPSMTYKKIIDTKKDLMNIKEISKFDGPFSILYYLYYGISDVVIDCGENLKIANSFVNQFNDLNNDPNNKENSSYNKLLSTLSNDYNNLKKLYKKKSCDFPDPPGLTPQTSPVDNSVKVSGQTFGETSEGTSSNSLIASKLIPALLTFSVIPVFLGVAYKVNNK
ncbi:CIR protein PIR protein [Plasmodium vinckei vinckei]|uniref:CIR protein PIR protein n=1 Tax=Plasmodium vinckei vinckei TaxID=54757 RepID=A0A449BVU1_PLAVN|nr:CIR protein PIR protein [Plasmodium vinckei vinckei]VEV57595.1 CIR protein PIR protein [Plasmodium vinckei vinckei]